MARTRLYRVIALLTALMTTLAPMQAYAFSRVKDLVDVQGIRDNMLVGYGLVVA